ncbi:hypothetical protein RB594_000071 [Gaeumannomyces avenae]
MANETPDTRGAADIEKIENSSQARQASLPDDSPQKPDNVSADAQAGVQAVEATTIVWGKWHLVGAYGIIWLIYFITSTQEVVLRTVQPFITSTFSAHPLTATTTVMSSIFGGLSKLVIAKILDTWGRPQGLTLTLAIWVVGIAMMAASRGVEMYATAMVFSTVGAQGVSYCLTVFIADTSSLRNRGLMLAFATSPYIVTTWLGGPWADSVLAGPGWRWGVGTFAILTPAVVLPLSGLFLWNQRRARRLGLIPPRSRRLPGLADVRAYCVDVDLLGILLLAAGMALTLLALNIYQLQAERWRSPLIISFLVCGPLLLAAFAVWEARWAPVKFIPMHLLTDRTVFFAGVTVLLVFFSSAVWNSWFTSMLLVAFNQRVSTTTYITNIYRTGSCLSALAIGYLIRRSGRFRWVALWFGLPLTMLGVGLMIRFRTPEAADSVGGVVATQVLVALAGGPLVVAAEMAMMAPLDHQHVAAIVAILDLFGGLGTALGSTVATAIWAAVFPGALARRLPAAMLPSADRIYSSIYFQLGYPWGSPTRMAIAWAYADAQQYMLVASVCLLAVAWLAVLPWRDIRVDEVKQTKGNVV